MQYSTEQGFSASRMTAADIMDIISRLLGCYRRAADAVSAHSQVQIEDVHKSLKIQKSECLTFGFVYHDTNGQNHGSAWKTQSFLLNEICTVIFWQDCCGKGNLRKSNWNMDVRKFQIGNVSFFIVKKGLFLSVYVDDIELDGKKQILIRCWKYSTKQSIWENQHLSWISCVFGLHSTTMRNKQR